MCIYIDINLFVITEKAICKICKIDLIPYIPNELMQKINVQTSPSSQCDEPHIVAKCN